MSVKETPGSAEPPDCCPAFMPCQLDAYSVRIRVNCTTCEMIIAWLRKARDHCADLARITAAGELTNMPHELRNVCIACEAPSTCSSGLAARLISMYASKERPEVWFRGRFHAKSDRIFRSERHQVLCYATQDREQPVSNRLFAMRYVVLPTGLPSAYSLCRARNSDVFEDTLGVPGHRNNTIPVSQKSMNHFIQHPNRMQSFSS